MAHFSTLTHTGMNALDFMNTPQGNQWSKLLKEETRQSIREIRIGSPDGRLHFKNSDGRKAYMSMQDQLNKVIRLTDSKDGTNLEFCSLDLLIDAGWVID